jgi:hypothetical protein
MTSPVTSTITNDDDSSFQPVKVRKPSVEEWTQFQETQIRDQESAQLNLLLSCTLEPSKAELSQIVEDGWPALPRFALGVISQLGGAFAPGYEDAKTFDLAEVVKAAEQQEAIRGAIVPSELAPAVRQQYDDLEPLAKIAEGLGAEGFTIQHAKDALARWRRKGQILGVYAPSIGYVLGSRPSFSILSRYLSATRRGQVFDPQERLVYACAIHPSAAVIDARLREQPAAVSVLCALLKGSSDEVNQTAKKG